MAHAVARFSGWTIGDDEPQPGDTIEFPGALTTSPRGPEKYAWSDNLDEYTEEQPPLTIRERTGESQEPSCCGFCSPEEAIAERGVYDPDYVLVTPNGEALVYTCHACIADAEIVDE